MNAMVVPVRGSGTVALRCGRLPSGERVGIAHEVAWAGKAFLCRAMARWVDEEGLSLDVCSEGELAVARSVGFPAERILLHGNGKTPHELAEALEYGVGRIVVDSAGEVARLAALTRHQKVLVRVTSGIDAHVHKAVTTGTEDQKFGLSLASGAAADVVRRVLSPADPGARRAALPPRESTEDLLRRDVG